MQQKINKILDIIKNALKKDLISHSIYLDELTITVPKDSIAKVLLYLRDSGDTHFNQLIDLCGVDYLERKPRFNVVYNLLSLSKNLRIRVKIELDENEIIPSATDIFINSNWYEREVWDMYGLKFSNHPDLRRLLTDYGFEGFPLRKDFPVTGYTQVIYDNKQKRVVYEPVKLDQEFREFNFTSPWKGMINNNIDEKTNSESGDVENV